MPSILFDDNKTKGTTVKSNGTTVRNPIDIYNNRVMTNGVYGGANGVTKRHGNYINDAYDDGGGGGNNVSSSDIQSTYNDELIAARDAELAALEARLQSSIDLYNQQLNQIKANYEGLRDQSEVDRYKSRRALREALANRGQLDSGYGRQEALNADLNYSNQLNAINLQEAQANQEVQNQINQLKADNLANKANIRARYAEALRQ